MNEPSTTWNSQCSNQQNGNPKMDSSNSEIQPDVFIIAGDSVKQLRDNIKQGQPSEERSCRTERRTSSQKIVVLTGACLNVLIALGFPFSIGALYVEIINIYWASRSEAALVQSLCLGFLFGAGIITGGIVDRFGVRKPMICGGVLGFLGLFASWFATNLIYLMATTGVVTGFGSSLIYMSSSVLVTSTFGKGRRLALPGLLCAAGLGGVLFPKLLEFLLAEYGLRGTLLICSGLYLNIVPSGFLITSHLGVMYHRHNQVAIKDTQTTSFKKKAKFLKDSILIIVMITAAVTFGMMNGMLVSMLDFIESRGIATDIGIQFLLIFNSTNTVTRLLSGFLTMIPRIKGAMIFCSSLIVCSTCLVLIRSTHDFTYILAFVVIFGMGYGVLVGIYPSTILEFVGFETFPFALGLGGFMNGLANAAGAAIMGLMFDRTRSYEFPLLVFGIIGNSAAVLTLLAISTTRIRRSYRTRIHVIN